MHWKELVSRVLVAAAIVACLAAPAGATSLVRMSLDELVADNGTVVMGHVLDAVTRWNDDHTFMLTDVRIAVEETIKGRTKGEVITVTLMGGRIGDLTTLILGGAELIPGNSYVLFLNREELPGTRALTVRDHVQGAFDIVPGQTGPRAVSQASHHPLMPDFFGNAEPPGGREGLFLDDMVQSVRAIEKRLAGARQEVK
jgi:hypothetical protein